VVYTNFILNFTVLNSTWTKHRDALPIPIFLISNTTHRSYEESIAALLPCFWIYQEVGLHIYKNAVPENPYQKWIDMYSGEEFQVVVKNAIDLTDRVAKDANFKQLKTMEEAFIT
jgi:thiaminase (transcriptional activator TenA)